MYKRQTYDKVLKAAKITYPKKTAKTTKHIASQIIAYQRLIMLDKLMDLELDKIVRVCVDGVYFWEHDADFSTPYDTEDFKVWGDKTQLNKMTLENSASTNYLSNIYDANETIETVFELNNGVRRPETLQDFIPLPSAKPRAYYRTELFTGQGGTGKTTYNLNDPGIIDGCFIAPSWKLARQMETDFKEKFNKKIEVNVLARLLTKPHCDWVQKTYCNFIIDEASQITEFQKLQIFKMNHYRSIFCGDLGYQLPPVVDNKGLPSFRRGGVREMTKKGFDNIQHFTTIHRCKCPDLLELLNYLRALIDQKKEYNTCIPHLNKNLTYTTFNSFRIM